MWNFPQVVGAINGKQIRIECPKLSGTLYHNCKGSFSMVLLAVCDETIVLHCLISEAIAAKMIVVC